MGFGVVVYLLTLCYFVVQISEAADDPNEWPSKYPGCAGQKQSPIALNSEESYKLDLPPLGFLNYKNAVQTVATNNGHTINVAVNSNDPSRPPIIFGGGLLKVYDTQSFHFHWGSQDSKGSEHEINGKKYDMEMHIIHKNIDIDSLDDALGVPGGVVVLGFLFEQTIAKANSKGLNAVCGLLPSLVNFESTGTLPEGFTLESIVDTSQLNSFYLYEGSLTTPPCTENITWVVSTTIQKISSDCLNDFFMLLDEENHPLVNNFRPIQPLNGRTVYMRSGLFW